MKQDFTQIIKNYLAEEDLDAKIEEPNGEEKKFNFFRKDTIFRLNGEDEKDTFTMAFRAYVLAALAYEHFENGSGLTTCLAVGTKLEDTEFFKSHVSYVNLLANELHVEKDDVYDFMDQVSLASKKMWQDLPIKKQNTIASLATVSVTRELMQMER